MSVVALLAFLTPAYRQLVATYAKSAPVDVDVQDALAAAPLNSVPRMESG